MNKRSDTRISRLREKLAGEAIADGRQDIAHEIRLGAADATLHCEHGNRATDFCLGCEQERMG